MTKNLDPSLSGSPSEDSNPSLSDPVLAYTAKSNLEAHSVVIWLESKGLTAHAVEDNSGVSTFSLGAQSFHKPQVFVERLKLPHAHGLLREYESQRQNRDAELEQAGPIVSQCEECGVESEFPAAENGTTQSCPKCHRFMDVGTFDWPEDFDYGEADEENHDFSPPDNEEDALDAAAMLDERGDWDLAVQVYQQIIATWPEHATYAGNCIAGIERKRAAGESG